MYKKLRIICAIISALFLVVILPAMTLFDFEGLVICGFGAGLFFFLTLIFRKAQQNWEKKNGIISDDEDENTENPTENSDENLEISAEDTNENNTEANANNAKTNKKKDKKE